MKKWGRCIRAANGMGLTWGTAWFGAGILLARVPGFYGIGVSIGVMEVWRGSARCATTLGRS